jgi:TPR repeat protein
VSEAAFDEASAGYDLEMKALNDELDEERKAFRAIQSDATELKDSYVKCAADLFHDAAQRGLSEAQFRMAQLFKGDEELPESWIPQNESEIEDKDRSGLNAYKMAVQELRLQEEADRKKLFAPFSFDDQIGVKVNEMKKLTALQFQHVASLSPKHARIMNFLDSDDKGEKDQKKKKGGCGSPAPEGQVRANVVQTPKTATSKPATATSSKSAAPIPVHKFEVLNMDDYAEQDFLDWRKRRFRIERAAFWFKKGAENGHHEAKVELATMLKHGHLPGDDPRKDNYIPFPRNHEQAAYIFREAAQLGNRRGQYEYAKCLLAGVGVEKNAVEAFSWLQKGSEQGLAGIASVDMCVCACVFLGGVVFPTPD